ncbi:capsule assembly protein Wzi [Marinirhabdus gelatinilytica]|uniref:Capsule assembly protein Wzi n=2 Tax=Marinirhabdus gelatinilytica TaxID=1703343 RepID=A0A370QGX7_9FLAO|nr:capsule assembly protein Wzi [Marinirhabdus gelatinilytica]
MVLKMSRCFILCSCIVLFAQISKSQEIDWSANTSLLGGIGTNDALPFWFYSTTENRWGASSNSSALAEASVNYPLSENASISAMVSVYYRDDVLNELQRKELYARFRNTWLEASIGAFSMVNPTAPLSATNKNIIFSGNTRPMLGVLLQAPTPLEIGNTFALDWGLGHFEQNDDRFVSDTRIHYKRLGLWVKFNTNNKVKLQIQHFAQWGGTSPVFGELNDDFDAFVDVFTARRANEIQVEGEILNAVGNHLGSYLLDYYTETKWGGFNFYHEHLFEDGSGSGFKNFPDGVWGLAFQPNKSKWIKGVSYEFITTKDQSGPERPDGYFGNNVYRSGWSYEGLVIGLPFIGYDSSLQINEVNSPIFNNRVQVHHLAASGSVKNFSWLLKTSFVENFGTYRQPFQPSTKVRYHFINVRYNSEGWGQIETLLGWDALQTVDDNFGIGLGYSYQF